LRHCPWPAGLILPDPIGHLNRSHLIFRAGLKLTLQSRIGFAPDSWECERLWVPLAIEYYKHMEMHEIANAEDVKKNAMPVHWLTQVRTEIDALLELGWSQIAAQTFALLSPMSYAIGRALNERDPCYTAATYALCDVIFSQRGKGASLGEGLPPRLYLHLDGPEGLTETDKSWATLEVLEPEPQSQPDVAARRGSSSRGPTYKQFVSHFLTTLDCAPSKFSSAGFCVEDEDGGMVAMDGSDVVAIDSAADDDHGCHAAIMVSRTGGVFPPNTAFRLMQVIKPGGWEAPGGVKPEQRLLVVRATYRPPRVTCRAHYPVPLAPPKQRSGSTANIEETMDRHLVEALRRAEEAEVKRERKEALQSLLGVDKMAAREQRAEARKMTGAKIRRSSHLEF